MSIKYMEKVVRMRGLTGTQHHVLMLLAWHADEEGRCFPHLATLAGETSRCVNAISAACRELVEAGYLACCRTGRGNRYEFTPFVNPESCGSDSQKLCIAESVNHTGCGSDSQREGIRFPTAGNAYKGQLKVNEKSLKTNPPPSPAAGAAGEERCEGEKSGLEKSRERSAWFERFWEVYPRKCGKAYARAAFERALAQTDGPAIIAAASRAAREFTGRDDRYIPYPANWLDKSDFSPAPPPPSATPSTLPQDILDFMCNAAKGFTTHD